MSILDLSADLGLIAVGFVTVNICIGLLMATSYSPVRLWPHRRIDIFRLHRLTAYGAALFLALHPAVLLLVKQPHFRVLDVVFPVWSPSQPLWNSIGAAALYLLAVVIISSLLRARIGRHWWRLLHWLNYAAAPALFLHSIFTDPELKGAGVDYLDGEKVYVELCALLIALSIALRIRHHVVKDRRERRTHTGKYAPARLGLRG